MRLYCNLYKCKNNNVQNYGNIGLCALRDKPVIDNPFELPLKEWDCPIYEVKE